MDKYLKSFFLTGELESFHKEAYKKVSFGAANSVKWQLKLLI